MLQLNVKQSIDIDSCVARILGTQNSFSQNPSEIQIWRSKIRALSKAITFVENDLLLAQSLLGHKSLEHIMGAHRPYIIGLTGLPGAGKSTLTNLLIKKLRSEGKKVAVLAIDPSSQVSGGAVLGDRIRLQEHFKDDGVYIRSMGSRGALGGVSYSARAVLSLMKLLPFDIILVESVGVGQSESDIVHLVDTSVLVLMPFSGDDVQLMKAGLVQMVHIFNINKCDLGDVTRMVYELEEQYGHNSENTWSCPVVKTSCNENYGIDDLYEKIKDHQKYLISHPHGKKERLDKIRSELLQNMLFVARQKFLKLTDGVDDETLEKIETGRMTSMACALDVLR